MTRGRGLAQLIPRPKPGWTGASVIPRPTTAIIALGARLRGRSTADEVEIRAWRQPRRGASGLPGQAAAVVTGPLPARI